MLPAGLYDCIIDQVLRRRLDKLEQEIVTAELDEAESSFMLARYLQRALHSALESLPSSDRLQRQVDTVNQIIDLLGRKTSQKPADPNLITGTRLLEIRERGHTPLPVPSVGLSTSSLLTGSAVDPSLASLLSQELQSADRVDILCAFVKWSGLRLMQWDLRSFCEEHSDQQEPALRVITTTYMGVTDERAVTVLSNLPASAVRVSYDTKSTRLHAKAYLFHRNSGYGTAYVGSSNISQAALTDGLEWNTRISQAESPHLWQKVVGTFDSYWNADEMTPYVVNDLEHLKAALVREQRRDSDYLPAFHFDVRPYPFQEEVLDRLRAERTIHNRYRNLVVAATGTGKTVIAGLDYKQYAEGRRPRLLFVAHREEILKQSLDCFRRILQDYNFGELLVGSYSARGFDHLFVSIQSFNSRQLQDHLPADFYDYIVVDEFHHAAARSYKTLLDHFKPRILLGLTATPERHDNLDILHYFGGRIAAELRLFTAINRGLLSPFQYFGVSDSVSFAGVKWVMGSYDQKELSDLLDTNDERASLVVREVHEKLLDPHSARGLGFCASVRHANFMARYFQAYGIAAEALSADTSDEDRQKLREALRTGKINFLFVVDLFNEGVDIPEVDTILFLRPTESLTVFLQQLGRGLRISQGKECLTVLDFIGDANRNFRFGARFAALTGRPVTLLPKDLQQGMPYMPAGCSIRLEKQAMEHVLRNIEASLNIRSLPELLRHFEEETGKPLSLQAFMEHHGVGLETIYRNGHGWSWAKDRAFGRELTRTPVAKCIEAGLCRLIHLDAPAHIMRLLSWLDAHRNGLQGAAATLLELSLNMLFASLFGDRQPTSREEAESRLNANPGLRDELYELLTLKLDMVVEDPPTGGLPFSSALELHARYSRDELLAGLGAWSLADPKEVREGVYYNKTHHYDLFFVTLNKAEEEYSPTTMYQDYAIDERLFHWQSQSTTSQDSATGIRYQQHGDHPTTILLAVREDKVSNGRSAPYWFLGPAHYRSHTGSRPMSITLELEQPISARLRPRLCRLLPI